MNLNENELAHVILNNDLPQQVKEKIYIEIEKTELMNLIYSCQDPRRLVAIKFLISTIINKENGIEEVSSILYDMYEKW